MKVNLNGVTRIAGKAALAIKKASPELMLGVGVVGVVGAAVMACKATLKAKDIIEDTHNEIDEAQEDLLDRSVPEKYRRKEIFKIYIHHTSKMAAIYAPAAIVGGLSLALIIGSHCVLNRRYLGTTAAYKALEEAYRAYRKRVIETLGEEKEKEVYYGAKHENDIPVREVNNETGEAVITPTKGVIVNPDFVGSPYARFFDETSTEWQKNSEFNRMFLTAQQNYANNLLKARGHLFLNEVYDMLGLPRSQAGAVVGWLLGAGDDFVDFGIYNAFNEKARDFVNGLERSILLDFNVDGVIYDKI